ncbi:hypothetical protein BDR07DRAFT_252016 [Suillus spraguei]|nr:hypothetical protein BDR07DRAFT_252016 [Suillus spraguei]
MHSSPQRMHLEMLLVSVFPSERLHNDLRHSWGRNTLYLVTLHAICKGRYSDAACLSRNFLRLVSYLRIQVAYVDCTMIFGYLMWVDLKRRVQQKRIESVVKVE